MFSLIPSHSLATYRSFFFLCSSFSFSCPPRFRGCFLLVCSIRDSVNEIQLCRGSPQDDSRKLLGQSDDDQKGESPRSGGHCFVCRCLDSGRCVSLNSTLALGEIEMPASSGIRIEGLVGINRSPNLQISDILRTARMI